LIDASDDTVTIRWRLRLCRGYNCH